MEFLKALEPYVPSQDFARFMALVKAETEVVAEYSLAQNYPNPFNPITSIQYSVISDQSLPHITLKIFNLLGQEVRTLVDEVKEPGYYTVTWDGRDEFGAEAASGVYFYRLTAGGASRENGGDFTATKRMLLLK